MIFVYIVKIKIVKIKDISEIFIRINSELGRCILLELIFI